MSNPHNLPEHHEDHPEVISRNARRGLGLFAIYFALYAGFVGANVFAPQTMTSTFNGSLGGPNLAVVSGIGLIFAAIALSLVYMRMTRLPDNGGK